MKPHQESPTQTLAHMIRGIRFAMLTTIGPDGSLQSRPMTTQDLDADGRLFFFTHADSAMVEQVQRTPRVNVAYAEPGAQRFVSVSGVASISRDRAKMQSLWSPLYKAWFPKELDDPQIALIVVDVEAAEYWHTASSKMVELLGFAKAAMTGQASRGEGSRHERLDMRR